MRNFSNNDSRRSQGRRSSGGRGFDRSRHDSQNGRSHQMYDAVCSDCNKPCRVPFMPTSGKPIYCSECFEKRGNSRGNDNNDSRRPRSSSFSNHSPKNYDKQFKTINEKLDVILKILMPKEEVENVEAIDLVADKADESQTSDEPNQDTPEVKEAVSEVVSEDVIEVENVEAIDLVADKADESQTSDEPNQDTPEVKEAVSDNVSEVEDK